AGSRAGIKSIIVVKELNKEGTKVISDKVIAYDGHEKDPTIEGPKFYKRNGYYYIFAPAGGVSKGWQTVLRSKNVYGPYERRVVMDQGESPVNGPHQGAWVTTQTGEDWFLHFQDKEAYGRVVHLQPMKWINDWPVIGEDKDGDGKGQPVLVYKKPNVGMSYPVITPQESDEFNGSQLGLQWQWQANPKNTWAFSTGSGSLRMFAVYKPDSVRTWELPNILAQKFPSGEFTATAKLKFRPKQPNEKIGLIVLGTDYAFIAVKEVPAGPEIIYTDYYADMGGREFENDVFVPKEPNDIYLRVKITKDGNCIFSFSTDGVLYMDIEKQFTGKGKNFIAKPGRWVGGKVGLFCTGTVKTNDSGFADIDWFRIEKN
ncbi:MAG TPA: family 43 glycosylhydrolase, partial [Chitinophagaceae bacterium]